MDLIIGVGLGLAAFWVYVRILEYAEEKRKEDYPIEASRRRKEVPVHEREWPSRP